MISALLLCAGESRRMGTPKMLLNFGSESLVRHSARQLLSSTVDEVIAITGFQAAAVEWELKALSSSRLRVVYNPHFMKGLMSSIQAGVRALAPNSTAFLITPADLPYLTADDYDRILGFAHMRAARLARYVHQNQPAHPAYVSTSFRSEILSAPVDDRGLNFLFARYPTAHLEVDDARGSRDIDTPEDYRDVDLTP